MSRNQTPSLMQYQVGGTPVVMLIGLAIVGIVIGTIAAGIGIRLTARSTDQSEFVAQYITTVAALYDVEHSDPAQAGQALANARQRLMTLSTDKTTLPLDTIGSVAGQYQAFRPNTQDAKNVIALANALNAPITTVTVPPPGTPSGPGPSSATFIIVLALITVIVGIVWFVMMQRSQAVETEDGEEAAGIGGFAGRFASRFRRMRIPSGASPAAPITHQYSPPRQLQSRRTPAPQAAVSGYEQPAYQQQPPARPQPQPRQPQANGSGTLPEYEPAEEPVAHPANAANQQRNVVRPVPQTGAAQVVQPINRTFHFDYRSGDEPYQPPFTIEGNERGVMIASAGVDPGLRLSENPDRYCSFLVWLFDDTNEEGSSVAILSAWVDSQNMPEIDAWLQQSGPQTTVVANRGTLARLETSTAVMEVVCNGFAYGNDGDFPPRSFFSQLSIDLRVTVHG